MTTRFVLSPLLRKVSFGSVIATRVHQSENDNHINNTKGVCQLMEEWEEVMNSKFDVKSECSASVDDDSFSEEFPLTLSSSVSQTKSLFNKICGKSDLLSSLIPEKLKHCNDEEKLNSFVKTVEDVFKNPENYKKIFASINQTNGKEIQNALTDRVEAENQYEILCQKYMCPICQDLLVAPHLLSCSHSFCLECIDTFQNSIKSEDIEVCLDCPLCLRTVESITFERILDDDIKRQVCQLPTCDSKENWMKRLEKYTQISRKKSNISSSSPPPPSSSISSDFITWTEVFQTAIVIGFTLLTVLILSEEREAILNYQYKGSDQSYVYNYVLSPIAQYVVDHFTPSWIAPNVITATGLFVTISAAMIIVWVNPNLNTNESRWLHLVAGASILVYQTLDNMDGKQARKTKSSSALGMLFDHGCDAINAGVVSIIMASALGTGWSKGIFFSLWCGFVPFYFQTWEEYYSGAMILPVINGPTEGLLIASGMCFISYLQGTVWWQTSSINLPDVITSIVSLTKDSQTISPFMMMTVVAIIGALITVFGHIIQVLTILYTKKSPITIIISALTELFPFLIFFPTTYCWCAYSKLAFSIYPVLTIVMITSIFVEISTHIMYRHITHGKLEPFKRYTALMSPILLLGLYTTEWFHSTIIESILRYTLTIFTILDTSRSLLQMCQSFAEVLNTSVFLLKKLKD